MGRERTEAGRRRYVLAIAFLILLLAVGAVPVLAATTPTEGPESPVESTQIPGPTATETETVERQEEEEVEARETPAATAEREESQEAFSEVSPAEAESLLVESFPESLASLNEDPGRVLTQLQVEKPLGTYAAVVGNGEGGELSLIEGSVPVESELGGEGKQPIDLTLEPSEGGFEPANPAAELKLPATAEGAIRLHEGLAVSLPASGNQPAQPLGEENLFIPETEPSTDTLLSPVGGGVEISEQLRSVESPRRYTFELGLPSGARLVASPQGGAEVLAEDGSVIEVIPPSSAVDAQGASVPVTTEVSGDDVIVEVAEAGESEYAYPILLDPEFLEEPTNFGSWIESPGGGFGLRNLGSSLNAYSQYNQTYQANTNAQWVYTAPGQTAWIAAATFRSINYLPGSCREEQPHGYIGLYNIYSNSYTSLYTYHSHENQNLENWEFQTGWVGGYGVRDAMIGIGTANEAVNIGCYHELYVGNYSIQEKDPGPPNIGSVSGVPGNWFDPSASAASGEITISSGDDGFGLHGESVNDGGATTSDPHFSCSGIASSRCPLNDTWSVKPAYVEGEHTLQVSAEDAIGQASSWTTKTKDDGTAPSASVAVSQTTTMMNARVETADGSSANPRSGVKEVKVYFDGKEEPAHPGTCSASGCEYMLNFTFSKTLKGLTAGEHTVEVIAFDQVGHRHSASASFILAPPDTFIDSGPEGLTKEATPKFTYHSSQEGSTFQCRVDTGAWVSCPATGYTTAKLADGPHTFEVKAISGAGLEDPTPASRSFTVDTVAPNTRITFGPPAATTDPTPTFGYDSNEEHDHFECGIDGSWERCPGGEWEPSTALSQGAHTFRVRAIDAAGNVDATPAVLEFTVDTNAPTVKIESGPEGATANTRPTFTFATTGASAVECSLQTATAAEEGPEWGACTTSTSYTPAAALGNGAYVFKIRARDAAGNFATEERNFAVDTVAPDTTILTGPVGPTENNMPTFTFSSNESGAHFECRFDTAAFAACSGPGASHTPTKALADGEHAFEVRAVDTAGNLDPTPARRTFTVVTNGPQTTITSGPSGAIATTTAKFTYSSNKAGTFQCRLDGAAFATCPEAGDSLSGLAQGEHTFEVRAVDGGGIADPTPASRVFVVDTTAPPQVVVTGAVHEAGVPGLTLTLEAVDGGASGAARRSGINSISLYADGNLVETWEQECEEHLCPESMIRHAQIQWQDVIGSHNFSAYANDGVSNTSPANLFSKTTPETPTMSKKNPTTPVTECNQAELNALTEQQAMHSLNTTGFKTEKSTLEGTAGNDYIHWRPGIKTIKGGGGCDVIVGGPQKETLRGGPGADLIRGGRSNDKIYGENGSDELYGGIGDDEIFGGNEEDVIDGGPGSDEEFGNAGNDTIRGGQGEDEMSGGPGTEDVLSYADAMPPGFAENPNVAAQARAEGIKNFPLENESGVYVNLNLEHPIVTAGPTGLGGGNDKLIGPNKGEFEVFVGSPFSDWIKGAAISKLYPGPGADVITESGSAKDEEPSGDSVNKSPAEVAPRAKSRIEIGLEKYPNARESDVYALGSQNADTFRVKEKSGSVTFNVHDGAVASEAALKEIVDTTGCKPLKSYQVVCSLPHPLGALLVEGGPEKDSVRMEKEEPKMQGGIELDGGPGVDSLSGGAAEELLLDGPDENAGEGEYETLRAGGGDDALIQGDGPDLAIGGGGNDLVISSQICGGDSLYGDGTGTTGKGGSNNAQFHPLHGTGIWANLKAQKLGETTSSNTCPSGEQETLKGFDDLEATKQADILYGSAGENTIIGRSGHDEMFGLGGRDTIDAKDGKKEGPDLAINCGPGKKQIAYVDSEIEFRMAKSHGCEKPSYGGVKHEDKSGTEEAATSARATGSALLSDAEPSEPPLLGELELQGSAPGATAAYPLSDTSGTTAASAFEEAPSGTYKAAGSGALPTLDIAGPLAESEQKAVRLDGVGGYVDLAGQGAPEEGAEGYAMAMYVRFTKATATEREFLFSAAGTGSRGIYVYREPNGRIAFATGLAAGAQRVLSSEAVNNTSWHQVVASIEGETLTISIDGYEQPLGFGHPLAIPQIASPTTYIGAGPGPAHFLAATVSEFGAFDGTFEEGTVLQALNETTAVEPALLPASPAETADADGDGIPNGQDNCPSVSNPAQTDADMNGVGDACEPVDSDGDEVPDASDNCPYVYNPEQTDTDGDGRGDVCEEAAPEAVTGAASELKGSSAKVSGTVDSEGAATTYQFVYGTTTEYGSVAPVTAKSAGSGNSPVAVSETLTGLSPNTVYHYRLIAGNGSGTDEGDDMTFTTPPLPSVSTGQALQIRPSSARVNGTVNPLGYETTYQFEFGKTTAYGNKAPATAASAGSGTSTVSVSAALTGLESGTTYHFRIEATSVAGTAYGSDGTFTTGAGSVTGTQLAAMPVIEAFNGTGSDLSEFESKWTTLGWGEGTPKGYDSTAGWRPWDAWPTVNGASYVGSATDTGSGVATIATMAAAPNNNERYFSVWLDMSNPSATTRNGYELRFFQTATSVYTVTISKWVGGVKTVLATQASYTFAAGGSVALVDHGGTVSAWVNTGAGFAQLLSASDAEFSSGRGGIEGSGNITKLTNFRFGTVPAAAMSMDQALSELTVRDTFGGNEAPLSEGGNWAALQWDTGTAATNSGHLASGWGPYDSFSTVNGAYWHETYANTGTGHAVAATLTYPAGIEERYYSLWLDAGAPATVKSGYELRLLEVAGANMTVTISKWVAGTKTVLATKTGYVNSVGSQFALAEKGGTVSAWTTTAPRGEYTQLLSAADSTFNSGYTGVEGSGSNTKLTNFQAGTLPSF